MTSLSNPISLQAARYFSSPGEGFRSSSPSRAMSWGTASRVRWYFLICAEALFWSKIPWRAQR